MENKTNTLLTVVLATNALSSVFTEVETEFVSAPPTFILSITHKKKITIYYIQCYYISDCGSKLH